MRKREWHSAPFQGVRARVHVDLLDRPHGKSLGEVRVGIDEHVLYLGDGVAHQREDALLRGHCRLHGEGLDGTTDRCGRRVLQPERRDRRIDRVLEEERRGWLREGTTFLDGLRGKLAWQQLSLDRDYAVWGHGDVEGGDLPAVARSAEEARVDLLILLRGQGRRRGRRLAARGVRVAGCAGGRAAVSIRARHGSCRGRDGIVRVVVPLVERAVRRGRGEPQTGYGGRREGPRVTEVRGAKTAPHGSCERRVVFFFSLLLGGYEVRQKYDD